MTVWSPKLTVRGPGAVTAEAEMVTAEAKMADEH